MQRQQTKEKILELYQYKNEEDLDDLFRSFTIKELHQQIREYSDIVTNIHNLKIILKIMKKDGELKVYKANTEKIYTIIR